MSTATLRLHDKAIHHKAASVHFIKVNWKIVYALAALGAFVMLICYIFTVNQLTQGAFLIKTYHKQIQSLTTENRDLQTSFAENSFLGLAQQKAQDLSFQKTTSIKYIQVLQSSLAEAK